MFYPFRIPSFIQRVFPKYLWSKSMDEEVIYLTFDDGPTPEITPWVLNLLEQYNAKATFFCIGKNLRQHPVLVRQIVEQQHKIGNHSFSHLKGWQTKSKNYINDILQAAEIIQSTTNNTAINQKLLFRPPYGQITKTQANVLIDKGFTIVLWDILTGDFDPNLNPEKSLKKTLKNTKPGSIVVFHDSLKAKKNLQYILPNVLKHWSQQGYQFKTL
jgi:peptidoglycan/xylan/chitin deacetylase (PgdA/CDA1 family)